MTRTQTSQPTECRYCGSTEVTWAMSKARKWYLANVSQQYENGARYLRGPHFKTCPGEQEYFKPEPDFSIAHETGYTGELW